MKNLIGQRIRILRKTKELTQENLAYELGITKGAYNKIETGKSNISISRLEEIANILEVDVADLFKDTKSSIHHLEEPPKNYGFATKRDVEELARMIQELAQEIQRLKTPAKATSKRKNPRGNS